MKPLAIDLCCGLGGWTEGLLAEGYHARGYDIEEHVYGDERYPGELVVCDVLEIHGSEFADAALIVASPPCQEYSYMAMPWSLAKAKAARIRADETGAEMERLNRLFNACFRIQREASETAGRRIPMVVENVRGAQPWVGRAAWNFGSYYLWGDVPALMPRPQGAGVKVGGMGWYPPDDPRHQVGAAVNPAAQGKAFSEAREGRKVAGFRFDGSGRSFQTASVEGMKAPGGAHVRDGAVSTARLTNPAEGRKNGNDWCGAGENCSLQRRASSKSSARKGASAKIAKIPFALSSHIARVWLPERAAA